MVTASPSHSPVLKPMGDYTEGWVGYSLSIQSNDKEKLILQIFMGAMAFLGASLFFIGFPITGASLAVIGLCSIFYIDRMAAVRLRKTWEFLTQELAKKAHASADFHELPKIDSVDLHPPHEYCSIPGHLLDDDLKFFRGVDKDDKTTFVIGINKVKKRISAFPLDEVFNYKWFELKIDRVTIPLEMRVHQVNIIG